MNIVLIIAGIVVGGVVTWVVLNTIMKSRAEKILKDAESEATKMREEKIREAKQKFQELKNEYDSQCNQHNAKMQQFDSKLKQREMQLKQFESELQKGKTENENLKESLNNQLDIVNSRKQELEKLNRMASERLETISGLSAAGRRTSIVGL